MKEFEILTFVIAEITGTTKEELVAKRGLRRLVELRMMSASILKEFAKGATTIKTGALMNVDHSTVVHYLKTHENLLFSRKEYKLLYEKIRGLYLNNTYMGEKLKSRLLDKKQRLLSELSAVDNVLNAMECERLAKQVRELDKKQLEINGRSFNYNLS